MLAIILSAAINTFPAPTAPVPALAVPDQGHLAAMPDTIAEAGGKPHTRHPYYPR